MNGSATTLDGRSEGLEMRTPGKPNFSFDPRSQLDRLVDMVCSASTPRIARWRRVVVRFLWALAVLCEPVARAIHVRFLR